MKKTYLGKMGVFGAVTFACAGVALAVWLVGNNGQSSVPGNTVLASLSGVSAPELPAVAARLVAQAAPDQRDARTIEVMQAVNALSRPSALPYVVSAISAACPDVTVSALNQVVTLQPEAGVDCAKAALAAAPQQTMSIVSTICRQQPEKYSEIALAAATQTPAKSAEIYAGLAAGLPQLQPLVAKATNAVGSAENLPAVIEQLNVMVVSAARGEAAALREQLAMEAIAPAAVTVTAPATSVAIPTGTGVTPSGSSATVQPATPVNLAANSYTVLVPVGQRGPPHVTPLTPPVIVPNDTAVRNTKPSVRPYSEP